MKIPFLIDATSLTHAQRRLALLICMCFFVAVGGYWLVRPMKMGVLVATVGLQYEPQAKFGTVIVLIPLLFLYNKLVTVLDNPRRLAYIVCVAYAGVFVAVAMALKMPGIGLSNPIPSPDRWLGWITYWAIESYGSIIMPMFWSVAATLFKAEAAAVVYPTITIAAQLGAISGATLATYTKTFGFATLFLAQAAFLGFVMLLTDAMFRIFYSSTAPAASPSEVESGASKPASAGGHGEHAAKPAPTGLFEGFRLIATQPYVTGILVVSTFSEVVATVLDFQMMVLGEETYPDPERFSEFMGRFGQAVNVISLIFALTGTKVVINRFGLMFCLVAFPVCTGFLIVLVYMVPSLSVLFVGMVAIKALGYSLNSPAKEMLYIQTSKDVKFKAKSWIDMFGSRMAKGVGSLVNNTFRTDPTALLSYGSAISGLFVAVWVYAAQYLGRANKRLVLSGEIIS